MLKFLHAYTNVRDERTEGAEAMGEKSGYYIVNSEVLPEVFHNVIEAKRLLKTGKAATIHEAVKMVGISRSAFYKYKDSVFSFSEGSRGKIITLSLTLSNIPGVLSGVLNAIAKARGNILTINQNIPIHDMANVTISIDTREICDGQEAMIGSLSTLNGVQRIEIIAQE